MLYKLLSIALILFPFSFSVEYLKLNNEKDIADQFSHGAITYVVSSKIDLKGQRIEIPKGAVLLFKGGTLFNGELSGSFYTKGIKKGSLSVIISSNGYILSQFPVYNNTPKINASILSSCLAGITLKEDIEIDTDVNLHCSIDGGGHRIISSERPISVLRISNISSGISIKRLEVHRSYSGEINKNYAIYCKNSSNVTIEDSIIEGRLHFVNNSLSENASGASRNFSIRNCELSCDLSSCPQGWQYGQDHIAFYSIQDISISNCKIVSVNVNRVLKTSQYFVSNDYSKVNRCTKNVIFCDNKVKANSQCGKQVWDMFCGTVNVLITRNTFDVDGFSRVFENKSYQDKYENGELLQSDIVISDNTVNALGADLFQFRASPKCDCFLINGNVFQMGGTNLNSKSGFARSCGGYLQGYKRLIISNNSFIWKDEAINLLFLKANFSCLETIVENNKCQDVYRVNVDSAVHPSNGSSMFQAKTFDYHGNTKYYSEAFTKTREEIYMSNAAIIDLNLQIEKNVFNSSYESIFAQNVSIDNVTYNTQASDSKSLLYKSVSAPWHSFSQK